MGGNVEATTEAFRRWPADWQESKRAVFAIGAAWQREQDDYSEGDNSDAQQGEINNLRTTVDADLRYQRILEADLARYKAFTEAVMALVGVWETALSHPNSTSRYPDLAAFADGQNVARDAAAQAIRDAAERAGVSAP